MSAKSVGTGFVAPDEPLNPRLAVPPVPMAPFHAALATVTWAPDCVTLPFQSWVTVCPAVKDHVNCHEVTGSPRLVRLTFAPNPPDHWLETW